MFDIGKFGSTFQDRQLNGFDVMVMNSAEMADKIIEQAKDKIDYIIDNGLSDYGFSFSYDDTDILDIDQRRIEREIEKYCALRGINLN